MGIYPKVLQQQTTTTTTTTQDQADQQPQMSWAFDADAGDLSMDGTKHVQECDAERAWQDWIFLAINTPNNMPAYGFTFGIDEERLTNLPYAAFCAELSSQLTRICKLHPLTDSVSGFTFRQVNDAVYCAFTATSKHGASAQMETTLRR